MKFDFSGWATKNDLTCSDGRTIKHNAFKENDGQRVPLVWQHGHNAVDNVLGHALLENRDEGVYAYCALNDTSAADNARSSSSTATSRLSRSTPTASTSEGLTLFTATSSRFPWSCPGPTRAP